MVSCSGILSVIICKHRLAELRWRRVSKIHFSVYTIGTKSINDFQFSKIDFKTEFEKKYLNGQNKFTFRSRFCHRRHSTIYIIPPNNIKETIIQRITFQGKIVLKRCTSTSFSTEFVYFQFKHGFNRVTILKK
jgi:hypothetical protein